MITLLEHSHCSRCGWTCEPGNSRCERCAAGPGPVAAAQAAPEAPAPPRPPRISPTYQRRLERVARAVFKGANKFAVVTYVRTDKHGAPFRYPSYDQVNETRRSWAMHIAKAVLEELDIPSTHCGRPECGGPDGDCSCDCDACKAAR